MTKRHPVAVVVLTLLTFTVYAYYWLYRTTDELRRTTGRDDLSPAVDVILTLLTFGLWGIWAGYRNAKIAHEALLDRGEEHPDRSLAVAGFAGFSLVSGWAWLVAIALLQDDFNRLAEPVDHLAEGVPYEEVVHERAPARVRVEVPEPAASRPRAPAFARPMDSPLPTSAWDTAPSAPVFTSNAPAPIVY